MTNPELLAEIERARCVLDRLEAELIAEADPQRAAELESLICDWQEDYFRLVDEREYRLEKLQERAA